jgi:L-2-amino-thiazoline-4-carboxylic acid hydrolase-like protein
VAAVRAFLTEPHPTDAERRPAGLSAGGLPGKTAGVTLDAAAAARLVRSFDGYARRARPALVARFGQAEAARIIGEARAELEHLAPAVPEIGRRNPLRANLHTAAMYLALYRVLRTRGMDDAAIGRLAYDMLDEWPWPVPRWLLRLAGWWQFSPWYQRSLRLQAAASQRRRMPGDWVFHYVPGDGHTFDWGVDYTSCGILDFYRAQGAGDFVRFLCPLDAPMSRVLGQGLCRTHTLAEGAPACDFRYRRGGPTRVALPWAEHPPDGPAAGRAGAASPET